MLRSQEKHSAHGLKGLAMPRKLIAIPALLHVAAATAVAALLLVSQPVRAQEQPPASVAAVAYALSNLREPFPLPTWQYELRQIGTQAYPGTFPGDPMTSGETCILGCAGQNYVQAPPYVLVMDFDTPLVGVYVSLYTQLLGTGFVAAYSQHGLLLGECQGITVLAGSPSCTDTAEQTQYPTYPINQGTNFSLGFNRPEIASIVAGCYTAACSVGPVTHGTPEPGTTALMGAGLLMVLVSRRLGEFIRKSQPRW